MTKYFNSVNKTILEEADNIMFSKVSGNNFNYYNNRLNTGYVLVGLFDRLIFKQAPIITKEEDFNDFMEQYSKGMIISFAFYAVPLENI
jgi:hypothetical protein